MTAPVTAALQRIMLPEKNSHKGQNGKLLIIGGSALFHAASKWSLDIASKFVDMVFYASVPSNNALVEAAKGEFWNGIVIERSELENYLREADAILIGPGMERGEKQTRAYDTPPTDLEWTSDTETIVNYLLHTYPEKKWVVDAGALQMVDPSLLRASTIITPHAQELERVLGSIAARAQSPQMRDTEALSQLVQQGCTVLLKGPTDFIYTTDATIEVSGGNPGMTKGGTGDVLAGLIAALYTQHDALTAALVGSYINKRAGEVLAERVGPFFNASDLLEIIPEVFWQEWQQARATS